MAIFARQRVQNQEEQKSADMQRLEEGAKRDEYCNQPPRAEFLPWEATGIKMKQRAQIEQSETFSLWKKPNSPGAQEQAPRGNRTQVKKTCMSATAQLVP